MKRVRLEEALAGLPDVLRQLAEHRQGEAVVLDVRGGEVVAVVPAGTDDGEVIAAASSLRAAVRLDNERVLIVEIHEGASSASFRDAPADLHTSPRLVGAAAAEAVDTSRLGTVERIMTRDVVTASPDELVEDVAKRLAFHNVTGLPVEDWDGRIVGIVSELDVMGRINETIRDVMTAEVISVATETPIEQAAALMAERGIKRLPVLADGKLVGIISRADIVRALAGSAFD
jgi:CBS domain-containing protein